MTATAEAATDDITGRMVAAGEWLSHRGVPLVVRVTSAANPAIDRHLEAAGYTREAETVVMTAQLTPGRGATSDRTHPGTPTSRWLAAQQSWLGISAEDAVGWQKVLDRIRAPAAFASHSSGGRVVVVGIGVVRDAWLGLFEMTTQPSLRRRGHARGLVRDLIGWGAGLGATRSFLQVVVTNEPALRLYEGFGYRETYRYWYRRPQRR